MMAVVRFLGAVPSGGPRHFEDSPILGCRLGGSHAVWPVPLIPNVRCAGRGGGCGGGQRAVCGGWVTADGGGSGAGQRCCRATTLGGGGGGVGDPGTDRGLPG